MLVNRFDNKIFSTNSDLKELCKIKFENLEFNAKMQTFFTAKKHPINVEVSTRYTDKSADSSFDDAVSSSEKSKMLERTLITQSVMQPKRVPEATRKAEAKHEQEAPTIKSREVYISEISDSMTFYVQDIDFFARADTFIRQCNETAMVGKSPRNVIVGEMYLVYVTNKEEWHRGVVTEQKHDIITLYLVDQGRHVPVMLDQ